MMDYQAYSWGLFLYFGLLPGLIGAGLASVWVWQRGAQPARIWLAALKGFATVVALSTVLILMFLRY